MLWSKVIGAGGLGGVPDFEYIGAVASESTTDTLTFDLSTVGALSGDLVLIAASATVNSGTATFVISGAPLTTFVSILNASFGFSGLISGYLIASGPTVTVQNVGCLCAAGVAVVFRGASFVGVSGTDFNAVSNGFINTLDPPALSGFSTGSDYVVVLQATSYNDGAVTGPTGFTRVASANTIDADRGATATVATKLSTLATENPGSMSFPYGAAIVGTIKVSPA